MMVVEGHQVAFDEYDRLVREHDDLIPDETRLAA